MNIAEQMDAALAPMWIIDAAGVDIFDVRPGATIRVARHTLIQPVGQSAPAWERARRVIEGADA